MGIMTQFRINIALQNNSNEQIMKLMKGVEYKSLMQLFEYSLPASAYRTMATTFHSIHSHTVYIIIHHHPDNLYGNMITIS